MARHLLLILAVAFAPLIAHGGSVAGTYRCWSYNVGGAGANARLMPPLILHPDGTYEMSSEHGTYRVRGDQIVLSESKIRGPGRLQNGNQIVFEYTYRGLQHTVTYLNQTPAEGDTPASPSKPSSGPKAAGVTLRFPQEYGSYAKSVNTISLVPVGSDMAEYIKTGRAKESYDAIATLSNERAVHGSFRAVPAGKAYVVFAGTGFERRPMGILDLKKADASTDVTIDAPSLKRDPQPAPSDSRVGLGVAIKNVAAADGQDKMVRVEAVSDGSPAAEAGLKVGDIIVSANGREIGSAEELVEIVKTLKAGETIKIRFLRDNQLRTVSARIHEIPSPAAPRTETPKSGDYRRPSSDNSYKSPVSDGDYKSPSSDGRYVSPTTDKR